MQIIDECNTQVGKMRQMEELIHVSQTLEFDKLKVNSKHTHTINVCMTGLLFWKTDQRLCPLQAIPIISQTRYLEKKGELQEMSKGGTLFNMRAKFTPVYLFLFNDLFVITVKKGWGGVNNQLEAKRTERWRLTQTLTALRNPELNFHVYTFLVIRWIDIVHLWCPKMNPNTHNSSPSGRTLITMVTQLAPTSDQDFSGL